MMENKGVKIDIKENIRDEIVRRVVEGIEDIGIVDGNVDVDYMEKFKFREDYMVVVVKKGKKFESRRRIELKDKIDYDLIGI